MRRLLFPSIFVVLFVGFLASALSRAGQWPRPRGFVSDFAEVMRSDQVSETESYLQDVERRTGAEVAVVTLPSVPGGDVDGAAVSLFKEWGIGKKGKDNGVLFLVSTGDRRARIEVGYGAESVLPDAKAGRILRELVFPQFKQGAYGEGILTGAHEIGAVLSGDSTASGHEQSATESMPIRYWFFIIVFVLFILNPQLLLLLLFSEGRGGRFGGGGGGFGGGGFGGFGGGGSGGGGSSGGW